jgi:hypothetical protein
MIEPNCRSVCVLHSISVLTRFCKVPRGFCILGVYCLLPIGERYKSHGAVFDGERDMGEHVNKGMLVGPEAAPWSIWR